MNTDLSPALLRTYADRIEADLRENILPFWMGRVVDPERNSFHGSITNDLVIDHQAERGALLSARILWTFAAAYRAHGDSSYREMADYAYRDLTERFADRTNGGFIWSITSRDKPLRMRKQTYGQAFAIYALTEYHRAVEHAEALATAIETFRLLEQHARDPRQGGYREAFARDWSPIADMRLSEIDLNTPKSQNTLLHVTEAYTNLLRVWPDDSIRQALRDLLEVMLSRVLDPKGEHLRLFFSDDWEPINDTISFGHDIEASWLLTEAANAVNDSSLLQRVRTVAVQIAEANRKTAIDTDGALLYEGTPAGGVTRYHKEWWPQNEALVGFLNSYQICGRETHLRAALGIWDFCEKHLIDRRHGEWLRLVSRDHQVDRSDLKVSFWKCPYHNGRAAIEAPTRLRAIAAAG